MTPPLHPQDELERLKLLAATGFLDGTDPFLDAVVKTLSRSFQVPMAAVTLIADDEQFFISNIGLPVRTTPREWSFCAHMLWWPAPLVVPDALADARFADNPLVLEAPHIRFYAGVPIQLRGIAVGALCILDRRAPRDFGEVEQRILVGAGRAVEEHLIARMGAGAG